ncbi:MAG: shikimate kinase [Lachnospiraceae bacterium]|nr:shikimate kinase [Lachnospiraceae bacterium]
MNHIIIEGFMGSGKGSISKRVASELGLPIIDVDKKISDRMKMTPSEVYDRFGDVFYRAMETFILSELKKTEERSVIIIGSGLPTVPQSAAILKELGTVYYLKTDMSMIISRLDRGKKKDWLEENADLRERVKKLLEEREPSYLAAADVVIEAKKRTVSDIVAELTGIIRERDGETAPAEEAE